MAKKIESKRKQLTSSINLKVDKSKEHEIGKSRLQDELKLEAFQKNEELKIFEQQIREQKLKPTCAMLAELSRKKYEHDRAYRDELDWKHRIRCDGTPNPRVVQELNTYLFVWKQVSGIGDDRNTYVDKCLEIFKIMDAVDDIVDLPLDFNRHKIQCFREARDNLGRLLVDIVYGACYHLLSDYERRMDPVDLETVAYRDSCDAFAVGLHAVCHRPRLRTDDRPPPKCDFPECLVTVDLPPQLSQRHMAVMALWLRWDPYTDRMAEFDVSRAPESDARDLWQYSADTWDERNRLLREMDAEDERAKRERWMARMEKKLKMFSDTDRAEYPEDLRAYVDELENSETVTDITSERMDEQNQEQEQDVQDDNVDTSDETQKPTEVKSVKSVRAAFDKNPSQEIEKIQLEQMEIIYNSLKYPEKPNELNPRRYWIIGGAFNVEMWKLPMQPVEHQDGTVVVMLVGPAALQPIDYHEKYEPIQLSMGFSSTSSEDEETDVKKQNQEALKRLTLISIKLPENVLWFENPKPTMWNEEKKIWTTDYIYDIRFNEEKQTVSFRAGRMGSFGLAVGRYTNLPYQSWEVRPADGADGGVLLSVTAATVLVEFAVRGDQAAMVQLQNATTVALQEMVGAYHRPDKLVRLLRRGGVNLFPEPDARHYVDGRRPPKHAVAERHAYRCMAALSGTHQFAASRWNMHVAANRMVLQMKEIPPAALGGGGGGADGADNASGTGSGSGGGSGGPTVPFRMVMVTPERAVMLKCNEVSQAFSEEAVDGPFAPDLLALAADTADADRDDRRAAVDFMTAETLFYLMDKIKLLSYS